MATTATDQGFLLLHGWQNRRPAGHWQHWLADQLADVGHHVSYPQLPDPDHPDLERWLDELHGRLAALPGRRRTVVCHSLACLLWLHAAARPDRPAPVDRVILVAPPSATVVAGYPEIAAFAHPRVTADDLAGVCGQTRIIASDNDPYCPEGAAGQYGEPLGLSVQLVTGAGHLDLDAGFGPWPLILGRCLEDPCDPSPSST